jgi:hypothetical protein
MLIFARSRGATELAVRQNELNEVGRKMGLRWGERKKDVVLDVARSTSRWALIS